MHTEYSSFIAARRATIPPAGFVASRHPEGRYPFQRRCVEWAAERGASALFADTGLGKSVMSLDWADEVCNHTGGRVLVLAPLAVGPQTAREAVKFSVDGVVFARHPNDAGDARIVITNYDNLDKWGDFGEAGVVLDESSILKNFTSRSRQDLTDRFRATPYKLACTATPAPNDYTEIGNHAEWLGVCTRTEMLATYFVNDVDGKDGGKTANEWRLKGHAVDLFWDWVASWSRMVGKPSDVGEFEDQMYQLPPLDIHRHLIDVDLVDGRDDGALFRVNSGSATEIKKEQRRTAADRARALAEIVGAKPGPWLIWIVGDADGAAVRAVLPDVVEVHGSDKPEVKERRLLDFADGRIPVLMTKGSIAGMGLNFQACADQAFMGLDYSYERFYQQIRRSWRFGQTRPVSVHVVLAKTEAPLLTSLTRKQDDHQVMKHQMYAASRRAMARAATSTTYRPTHTARLPAWLTIENTP